MYCSGCGQPLAEGQAFCPACGRAAVPAIPPVPGIEYQLESYANKVRTLGVFWLVYAGLGLLLSIAGLTFAKAFFSSAMGPWMHHPMPFFMGPAFLHLVWLFLVLRFGLALAAGWGLFEHTQWGRLVAIVAAVLSLLKFPFGTALGIWTLVVLLGYRNQTLYDRL